jgi:hypothetical protein
MTELDQFRWAEEILEPGELVVFAPTNEYPYARIKVGDGKRMLKELDFFIDSAITDALKQVRFEDSIDGGRITEYTK